MSVNLVRLFEVSRESWKVIFLLVFLSTTSGVLYTRINTQLVEYQASTILEIPTNVAVGNYGILTTGDIVDRIASGYYNSSYSDLFHQANLSGTRLSDRLISLSCSSAEKSKAGNQCMELSKIVRRDHDESVSKVIELLKRQMSIVGEARGVHRQEYELKEDHSSFSDPSHRRDILLVGLEERVFVAEMLFSRSIRVGETVVNKRKKNAVIFLFVMFGVLVSSAFVSYRYLRFTFSGVAFQASKRS